MTEDFPSFEPLNESLNELSQVLNPREVPIDTKGICIGSEALTFVIDDFVSCIINSPDLTNYITHIIEFNDFELLDLILNSIVNAGVGNKLEWTDIYAVIPIDWAEAILSKYGELIYNNGFLSKVHKINNVPDIEDKLMIFTEWLNANYE